MKRLVGGARVAGGWLVVATQAPEAVLAAPLDEALQAALDADCAPESLRAFEGADPAAVRAALGALAPPPAPAQARYPLGEFLGQPTSYQLLLPEERPAGKLPVLVLPAHPTWGQDVVTPEQVPEGVAVLVVHLANAAYHALSERRYMRRAGRIAAWNRYVALVDDALTHALTHAPLDPERLVCAGLSAAGNACWALVEAMPDRWAGAWPMSAGWHPRWPETEGNFAVTPFRIQHGDADPLIPSAWPLAAIETLTRLGNPPEVVWLSGAGHGVYDQATREAGLAWVRAQRRPPAPERMRLGLRTRTHPDFWWLHVDHIGAYNTPWTDADLVSLPTIEARWVGDRVEIESSAALRGELRWERGEPGPGRGQPGQALHLRVNGVERTVVLAEDPTLAVESWCASGDSSRLWAGRVPL